MKMIAILLYNDTEKKVAEDLVHRMIQRAIAMDGTVTGEHGVGLKKREYLREELGEETVDAMRKVSFNVPSPLTSRLTPWCSLSKLSTLLAFSTATKLSRSKRAIERRRSGILYTEPPTGPGMLSPKGHLPGEG
jgi:hypothetical protein